MIKQINKELLMSFDFCGKYVIIETLLGGITERIAGTIDKQRWAGTAKEIIISVRSGLFNVGIDVIQKAYIQVDTTPKCTKCNKIQVLGKWIEIDVNFPEYLIEDTVCPACKESEA